QAAPGNLCLKLLRESVLARVGVDLRLDPLELLVVLGLVAVRAGLSDLRLDGDDRGGRLVARALAVAAAVLYRLAAGEDLAREGVLERLLELRVLGRVHG